MLHDSIDYADISVGADMSASNSLAPAIVIITPTNPTSFSSLA
jgi:hypothetical protein